jgi:DNA polymerase III subunit beta
MQFQISKSAIIKALSNVNGAVERRNTIPILLNVKIEAKDGRLHLTATDMDIVITSSAEALITENGVTTVPAQLFYDIIRKIPENADIKIALQDENRSVKISYGRSKFLLPTIDADEFPILSEGDMDAEFTINGADLIKIIDQTKFAIPNDETRHYLNGLFLHSVEENSAIQLRGIATDGHRLALSSSKSSSLNEAISGVIVPKKTINEIRKIIDSNNDVTLAFSKAKVKASCNNSNIISKLVDGQFPDYNRIIPQNNDRTVKVARKVIFDAMDRVATVATDKNKSIKLTLESGKISLQIKTNDNSFADEEIEVNYEGDTIEAGFNSKYFLEIIGQINQENLEIDFKDGFSPALIRTKDTESIYVIMPVRV